MTATPVRLRDVIVVGGGCYGTFYATQLAKAKQRGKAEYREVLIVDRDPDCRAGTELPRETDRRLVVAEWDNYFDRFLGEARPPGRPEERDVIVPAPHMPHLMFEWVARRARQRFPDRHIGIAPVPGSLGTPYDRTTADGTRYVSFADWVCPTHCVEPAVCPAIGRDRTWEMPDAVRALADGMRREGEAILGPALFFCRHLVFGVGTFAVDAVLEGMRLVEVAATAPAGAAVLVGTVSKCHGALNLLRVGPREPGGRGAG
jgi:hypothetical protein